MFLFRSKCKFEFREVLVQQTSTVRTLFDRNICALHINCSFNMRCIGSVFDENIENEELGGSIILHKINVARGQEGKDEKTTSSC